ncbi:DoxX family protein [Novosphingobium cyanobacteriorum]
MTRTIAHIVLALLYAAAGVLHILVPRPFLGITPAWVPFPELTILVTGLAELAGAAALLQPWSPALRRAGGWGLAAYAVCVFPANINHFIMDMHRPDHGLGLAYHVPRMVLQPALVWLALWVSGVIGDRNHKAAG